LKSSIVICYNTNKLTYLQEYLPAVKQTAELLQAQLNLTRLYYV